MKYKLFSLFFMLLLPISGHAQNATILFSTEQDCEISIYEPIDGGYNNQLPTTILKVTTNKPCIYSTDIVSFNFIYCQFSLKNLSTNSITYPIQYFKQYSLNFS